MTDRMTPEQVRRAFHESLGWGPRPADIAAVELLGASPEATAEYIWDHLMGEPRSPSLRQVTRWVKEAAATTSPPKLALALLADRRRVEVHNVGCVDLLRRDTVYPMTVRPDTKEALKALVRDVLGADADVQTCAGYPADSAS